MPREKRRNASSGVSSSKASMWGSASRNLWARRYVGTAALLTGLYSHQAGVGHMTENHGRDGYRGELNNQCITIAEALRPAGYRNRMNRRIS